MTEYQVALNNAPRQRVMALSALEAVQMATRTFRKARLAVAIDPSGRVSSFKIDRAGATHLLDEEPEDGGPDSADEARLARAAQRGE